MHACVYFCLYVYLCVCVSVSVSVCMFVCDNKYVSYSLMLLM